MNQAREIRDYLNLTVELGGSDLHLTVNAPPATRVNGLLHPLEEFSLTADQVRELILGTMNETQRATLDEEWELDYAIEVTEVGRFRGNVHFCRQNIEAVYRYIPAEIPDLSSLGHYPVMEDICHLQRGLILITGVTGSGKTTTLASLVQRISELRSGTIITLEDPIEFTFQHNSSLVKQREIGRDTKSFAKGLRQCMRQDPDVIVVGELRDRESTQIAMTAAETGHLVISTLHTIDAPKSIERIMDLFPADQQKQIASQLSNVLEAIICQRLLRRADVEGRVLCTEALRVNSGIQACLRERKIEQLVGLMEIARKEGCHTIDDCLETLVKHGYISHHDAIQNCRNDRRFSSESLAAIAAVKK
ncbi:MAG: twitching motility protein PilT [Akkermansiaceae bacterium]|jgi:twitching motility protein PilT